MNSRDWLHIKTIGRDGGVTRIMALFYWGGVLEQDDDYFISGALKLFSGRGESCFQESGKAKL